MLAAFPKAFLDQLCKTGEMSLRQWIQLSRTLGVDGLEFYSGFLDLEGGPEQWREARRMTEDAGMTIPMLCCSPDFTHPDPTFRRAQIDQERRWIDMTAELGGQFCRVLSGQRRPEVSLEDGLRFATDAIEVCLQHARPMGITLVIENHYKDNYWTYPEFAQKMDVFCELIERVSSDGFGVNYDPSNTILAGEDPIELLHRVKHRVITMHASDRYLKHGTIEDLRQEEDSLGYAQRLAHGVIGQGMNDYDAIFRILAEQGFRGWVSIEDGEDGIEQMAESVSFLREKMATWFD